MKIAAGAAKGLEYLHDKASPPVIYRDFKSSNILLGEDYYPKLSDFGLAKLGPVGDKTHVSTRVMGTYGYCAPEYAMTGQLTVKSDVYSFGVVFLELITGRKAIDHTQPSGEQNLVAWVGSTALSSLVEEGECPVISLYVSIAKCLISIKFAGTTAFQRPKEILPTCRSVAARPLSQKGLVPGFSCCSYVFTGASSISASHRRCCYCTILSSFASL